MRQSQVRFSKVSTERNAHEERNLASASSGVRLFDAAMTRKGLFLMEKTDRTAGSKAPSGLDLAITPADAVAKLKARNIDISERTLREMARRIGACRVISKKMFFLPEDIEAILESAKPKPKTRLEEPVERWTDADTEKLLQQIEGSTKAKKRGKPKRTAHSTNER